MASQQEIKSTGVGGTVTAMSVYVCCRRVLQLRAPRLAQLKAVDPQKRGEGGAGCSVLAKFAWVYYGRKPGVEAWMERACQQENVGAG